jgi:ADP-ribose pyrophosphatase
MSKTVKVIEKTRPYDGFFKIDRYCLNMEISGKSVDFVRENFERGHAAAVLLYDPKTEKVLVVEEFRIGLLAAGMPPEECFSAGPIAGIIDEGETAIDAVIREAYEEAGVKITASDIHEQFTIFSSPGGTSEKVTLMVAYADLPEELDGRVRGIAGEAEECTSHLWPLDEAVTHCMMNPMSGHLTSLVLRLQLSINGR